MLSDPLGNVVTLRRGNPRPLPELSTHSCTDVSVAVDRILFIRRGETDALHESFFGVRSVKYVLQIPLKQMLLGTFVDVLHNLVPQLLQFISIC